MLLEPQSWSCLPVAFAKALDIPFEYILKVIGHDGSELVYEDKQYQRGFHLQECIDVATNLKVACVPIEFHYASTPDGLETFVVGEKEEQTKRFKKYLRLTNYGVLEGLSLTPKGTTIGHAVAWIDGWIHDSRGSKVYKYKDRNQFNFCAIKLWRLLPCQ